MHGVTGGLAFCRNFHYESSRVSPGLLETNLGTARCASRRGSDLALNLHIATPTYAYLRDAQLRSK